MERSEYEILTTVEEHHWWHGGMRATAAALLGWFYHQRNDLRVLDAGCGVGGNMRFLQRYGAVLGIDYAPDALELSPTGVAPRLLRGSVLALPFADASFDLVTAFDVLYHRGVPDDAAALREFRRVLGPGGRLLLRLPAYEFLRSKHDRAVHTRHRYTATEVRSLLQQNSFIVERCTYVNTLLFPLALGQRMLEKALPALEQHESDLSPPHPALNTALRLPMALEAAWLSLGGSLPYGLSVLCLAHCGKIEALQPLDYAKARP